MYLTAPENIRKNLKSENDIYKFEYCSLDEKTYKIASYIPLEWKNGKLKKVLLASMDVTQEKKAEIESRQALKEASGPQKMQIVRKQNSFPICPMISGHR